MTELNLIADTPEQEKLKAYLQNNASEILASKINNGVRISKDGKQLLNKKTLTGFLNYANEEARKQAAKGAKFAFLDDDIVYGWAIHYFEEDSIEEKLYNEDGTEYQPPIPTVKKTTAPITQTPPKPKADSQISMFDMSSNKPEEKPVATVEDDDDDDGEELNTDYTPEELEEIYAEEQTDNPGPKKGSPMYQRYLSVKEKYKDCIVLYRLGDFYEMFEGDAVTSANELNLTLTGRDCGLAERVPMTGIPYHAADVYISKLVSRGYKVAVAEPLDGKSETTVERVIAPKQSESELLADEETGEILSESEMQKFDGDMEEPEELMTVSKLIGVTPDDNESDESDDDFDLEKERQRLKAFDKNALVILSDLLGNIFTLE